MMDGEERVEGQRLIMDSSSTINNLGYAHTVSL